MDGEEEGGLGMKGWRVGVIYGGLSGLEGVGAY